MPNQPIIVLRPADDYETDLDCNGCGVRVVFRVLETGRLNGRGGNTSIFRMCHDCALLLRRKVRTADFDA